PAEPVEVAVDSGAARGAFPAGAGPGPLCAPTPVARASAASVVASHLLSPTVSHPPHLPSVISSSFASTCEL
ncbi:unnamed protein product, partial [Closterium sp. NIES-53]